MHFKNKLKIQNQDEVCSLLERSKSQTIRKSVSVAKTEALNLAQDNKTTETRPISLKYSLHDVTFGSHVFGCNQQYIFKVRHQVRFLFGMSPGVDSYSRHFWTINK